MIQKVLTAYHEPMLNLHFLGPYLKNNSASLSAYELIFQLISCLPIKWRSMVLQDIQKEIKDCKQQVLNGAQENSAYLDKLLPLYHILMHMIINFKFSEESKEIYKDLAVVSHELRLNPLPYGLLPHELVEMFDNERILPGISFLYKTGEDFPYLNHYEYSFYLENEKSSPESLDRVQRHQRVLLFEPRKSSKGKDPKRTLTDLIGLYKRNKTANDEPLNFEDFNSIRYSFVKNLFDYYGQLTDDFREHLKRLRSHYIWNIYKQLSGDILDKASELRYSDIEQNFKQ